MSGTERIAEVAELDFVLEPSAWTFPRTHGDAIATHWEARRRTNPALYNGRVLLLGRRELVRRPDGKLALTGAYFEVDFAAFVAWRDFGFPGEPVENCFAMAALKSSDGAFLLGEMASHTLNAGHVYFAAGTPDRNDVFDGKVDLDASARRELFEETGVSAHSTEIAPGWTLVFAGPRIACMKEMTIDLPAEDVKARIDDFLASDPQAELSSMHIVRRMEDLDPAKMPDYLLAYLRAKLGAALGPDR